MPVERVDPQRERHVVLELGRAPAEHEVPARRRPARQLGQQARLADPRLAEHAQRLRRPALDEREHVVYDLELRISTHQLRHAHAHRGRP